MKERPILFSAPMVTALLAGAKTQTRRPMRVQPHDSAEVVCDDFYPTVIAKNGDEEPGPEAFGALWSDGEEAIRCHYGKPGERLWVRETWGYRCSSGTKEAGQFLHTIAYRADEARQSFGPMPMDGVGLPKWRERKEGQDWESWDATMTAYWRQWRPSIFMPRWASRITLELVSVRAERLHDISRGDAMAEGCPFPNMAQGPDPRQWYAELWEQINGPGAWGANPWVWVVEFKRLAAELSNVGIEPPRSGRLE